MPEFQDYWQYRFTATPEWKEILPGLLNDLPFEGFEETEEDLIAYALIGENGEDLIRRLMELQQSYPFQFERLWFPGQNWNEVWESNFHPVQVGDFCRVRALFHPPDSGVLHEIVIQPQMAFGTGHHETTFMMMETMAGLDFKGARVFDFGCGTGILGILAAKMGASSVIGVDIEKPAYENAQENIRLNQVSGFEVVLGDLDAVPESGFDIILANINRNVILATLPALYQKTRTDGILLVSGILIREKDRVTEAAAHAGFSLSVYKELGDWSCYWFDKRAHNQPV